MAEIRINFDNELGIIKPMHGVGQPPMMGTDTEYFDYLSDAHIPYSRLHDVGGMFASNVFVDIPNIFRDFSANADDPASYDFSFTDILIKALIEHHCEPIYRLGVTIENAHKVKAYRIYPPENPEKWARICEHIIRHYNEGWADGFFHNIKYWEIWNEPDGHPDASECATWKGTAEDYYELYRVTSRHLRKCFGSAVKIGGYASCGFYWVTEHQVSGEAFGTTGKLTDWESRSKYFVDFFDGFIKAAVDGQLPFDFFSHHSYSGVKDTVKMNEYAVRRLHEAGFDNVEIHLNEWNTNPRYTERGTSQACAEATAMMCAMQDRKMDIMCYYDARIGTSVYGGLFDPMTYKPLCTYYGFKAFGELYAMGTQVKAVCSDEDIYVTAAKGKGKKGILLSNTGADAPVHMELSGVKAAYLIDDKHLWIKSDIDPRAFIIKKNQVVYIEA